MGLRTSILRRVCHGPFQTAAAHSGRLDHLAMSPCWRRGGSPHSFEAVPRELEDAALVDGCGSFAALRKILLPAVVPGLITVGLFAFLAAWNDFFAPLILISDPSQAPLPLAIATLRQQTMGAIDYGATEAGVVVMALPCVVLFLVLQRYYVRGFMSGAVKG
jgi:multiple sugar transport system permease protein